MNLTIDRVALVFALRTVAPAASRKPSTLPITCCVLVESRPWEEATQYSASDRLSLRATNLDLTITTHASGIIEDGAPLAVPLDILEEYLATVQGDRVTLATRGSLAEVTCERNTARISTMQADDFPTATAVPVENELRVEPAELRDAIKRVVFAAARNDNRPVLAGVLWQIRPGSLTLVAADGFRLAVQTIPTAYAGEPASLIVPAGAAAIIAKIIRDKEVIVRWAPGIVSVEAGGTTVTAQQIAGTFPDYAKLIPTSFTSTVRLPLAALSAAIRTAATFVGNSLIIRLVGRDGNLTLLSTDAEVGDSCGSVDATVEGEACRIALNAEFLAEALGSLPGGTVVELRANTPSAPCVLRVVGETANTIVMMPILVPQEAFEVREAMPV